MCTDETLIEPGLASCLGSVMREEDHLAVLRIDAGAGVPLENIREITKMDFNLKLNGKTYKLAYAQYYALTYDEASDSWTKDAMQPHFALGFVLPEGGMDPSQGTLVVYSEGYAPLEVSLAGYPSYDNQYDADTTGAFATVTVSNEGENHL